MEWLARHAPGGLRLWAARKAADRAIHWAALRGGADDPYVFARLGLFGLAGRLTAHDERARFGHLLSKAASGGLRTLPDVSGWRPRERRRLASAIAQHSPSKAADILPASDHVSRAACLLAAGAPDGQILATPDGWPLREKAAICANLAVRSKNHFSARRELNGLFGADGLASVLTKTDAPYTIADLVSAVGPPDDGRRVSVVMPYHNAAETLSYAARSILAQSWRNLELLLVDDRSTDHGPKVAQELAATDDRVRVLRNARTPGVYGARNTALAAANGEFVTFLDADDWSPAERLARQIAALEGHAVAIANHIRMDEKGAPVAPRVFPIVRPVPITLCARRATLLETGPFEEVPTGADSEYLARLEMLHGKRQIYRDPAVLLVALWRTGSLSRDAEGGMLGAEREAYRADWMFRHAGLEAPMEL